MDEMIDQQLIKRLRSERCWSQENLAVVSGISLRTVQRIENEGKCSYESKRALAAAFDLNVAQLGVKAAPNILAEGDSRRETALSWLELVDSSEYALSWQEAAPLFQDRISSEEWVVALNKNRKPLGKVVSRSIKDAVEHDSLPGVPDGEYTVITLVTSFDQKNATVETITLHRTNNDWRVAGYFFK